MSKYNWDGIFGDWEDYLDETHSTNRFKNEFFKLYPEGCYVVTKEKIILFKDIPPALQQDTRTWSSYRVYYWSDCFTEDNEDRRIPGRLTFYESERSKALSYYNEWKSKFEGWPDNSWVTMVKLDKDDNFVNTEESYEKGEALVSMDSVSK